jgi:hypothetical protein
VAPLSPERFALEVTISQETRDKLERATALLRHRNPKGDIADVLDRALDVLLEKLEREKFGATSRPRARGARSESADPRYVSNEVKRVVHDRDGEQCAFVSADGVRCAERGFLELDHRTPVALGGMPTIEGTRLLCRAHNQYEAERLLGADFMRAKRESARGSRAPRTERTVSESKPVETIVSATAPFDSDVSMALRGLGFKADETRRAMADSRDEPATNFEERIRAALAALRRSPAFRCSDGPSDYAGLPAFLSS